MSRMLIPFLVQLLLPFVRTYIYLPCRFSWHSAIDILYLAGTTVISMYSFHLFRAQDFYSVKKCVFFWPIIHCLVWDNRMLTCSMFSIPLKCAVIHWIVDWSSPFRILCNVHVRVCVIHWNDFHLMKHTLTQSPTKLIAITDTAFELTESAQALYNWYVLPEKYE